MVSGSRLRWMRPLFTGAQGVLALAAVYLLVTTYTGETPQVVHADADAAAPETDHQPDTLQPLAWYAPFWQRDFRQPPIPASAELQQTAPPPRELPQLLGTFVESGQRYGHFHTAAGKTRVHPVGGVIDSCEIVAIESGRALLKRGSESYWIDVPRPRAITTTHARRRTR